MNASVQSVAAESSTPAVTESVEAPPVRHCEAHRDRPVIGTCPRCGKYICVVCAPDVAWAPEKPCRTCEAILDRLDAPSRVNRSYFASGVVALASVFALLLATYFAGVFVGGLVFGVPVALLAIVVMIIRRPWAGYVLSVPQLLFGLMFGWPSIRGMMLCALPGIFTLVMISDATRSIAKANAAKAS